MLSSLFSSQEFHTALDKIHTKEKLKKGKEFILLPVKILSIGIKAMFSFSYMFLLLTDYLSFSLHKYISTLCGRVYVL